MVDLLKEIGNRRGVGPDAIALAWCASQAWVIPIAGARTGDQAERNAAALGVTLDAGEVDALDRATERWKKFPETITTTNAQLLKMARPLVFAKYLSMATGYPCRRRQV